MSLLAVATSGAGVVDPEVDARWTQFEELGCPSCHATEARTVGPSLLDIAERYDADPATITMLSGKVRDGGSGVWGPTAMPAQDFLSREQSEDLVLFILALDGEEVALPKPPKPKELPDWMQVCA